MTIEELRIKRIAEAILPFLENESSILDIGCGNGDLGYFLKKNRKISYHGVDILEINSKNNNFITKSDMPYPFDDKSFDIVILILTLHHFSHPESGLLEAIRLSRKKILLLEDVPRSSLEKNLMKFVDYIGNRFVSKDIPLPFNFYNDHKWKSIFLKYNLRLNNTVNVYPLPFPRLNHYLYEVLL